MRDLGRQGWNLRLAHYTSAQPASPIPPSAASIPASIPADTMCQHGVPKSNPQPNEPKPATANALDYAHKILHLTPDPVQSQILASPARQIILNCARQWGKSTVASVIGAHTLATAKPGSQILIVAPSKRQSLELLRRIAAHLEKAGHKLTSDGINEKSIQLENGSRAIALPGTEATTRCFSDVALLIVDEAARVNDETYKAVRAFLIASHGRLLILSTPYGVRGFFYEEWQRNSPDFERYSVRADQCPRYTREILESEHRSLGDLWFRQEYLCEFLATADHVFEPERIYASLSDVHQPLSIRELYGPLGHITPWGIQ